MTRSGGAPAQAGAGDDYNEFEDEPGSGGQQEDGEAGTGETGGEPDATEPDAQVGDGSQDGQPEDLDDDLADFGLAPAKPTRGENRLQRLANEKRALEDEVRRLRTGTPQVTQPTGPTIPGIETEEQFRARLLTLNPEERIEAKQDRQFALSEFREQVRDFNNKVTQDKILFDSKVNADARYKRWAERVETKHQELLRGGQFVDRETVFKFLLGEHLLSREGAKEAAREAKRGQRRVERQSVRPGNAGSDVGGGRRPRENEAQARARRLDGMQI